MYFSNESLHCFCVILTSDEFMVHEVDCCYETLSLMFKIATWKFNESAFNSFLYLFHLLNSFKNVSEILEGNIN